MEKVKQVVIAKDLHKSYGKLKVLKGVSFTVERGSVLALLGPNGAGKTTTVKILSTLLFPDKGSASIDGYDVVKKPTQVRSSIGLTGQFAAVDEYLTGPENLQMIGRLYHLSRKDTKERAKELLKQFELTYASKRPVKTYSGGMKRRLDLAMSLIASPPVIFLDEPTTGLDPRSRLTMWKIIKNLAASGTTILLTTQYMDEADSLANQIIVMDKGKIIAKGTSAELKSKVGSDYLEIIMASEKAYQKAREMLGPKGVKADDEQKTLKVATNGGIGKLNVVLQQLEDAKVDVESIALHRPTLDDVFLSLTGRTAESKQPKNKKAKK